VLQRINRLPTASDLRRIAKLIALVAGVFGIVGIHRFWIISRRATPG